MEPNLLRTIWSDDRPGLYRLMDERAPASTNEQRFGVGCTRPRPDSIGGTKQSPRSFTIIDLTTFAELDPDARSRFTRPPGVRPVSWAMHLRLSATSKDPFHVHF